MIHLFQLLVPQLVRQRLVLALQDWAHSSQSSSWRCAHPDSLVLVYLSLNMYNSSPWSLSSCPVSLQSTALSCQSSLLGLVSNITTISCFSCFNYVWTVTPNGYALAAGFTHLGAGLACGLTGLSAGYAIGYVGDSVRQTCSLFK